MRICDPRGARAVPGAGGTGRGSSTTAAGGYRPRAPTPAGSSWDPKSRRSRSSWPSASNAAECVTVGNGTEALQLALEAIGVGAGDEVITSPMTAAFTALAIQRSGARAVFADVEQDTLNVSPGAVRAAITSKTRAIMPVHLYGHPAELQELGCDRRASTASRSSKTPARHTAPGTRIAASGASASPPR